MRQRAKRACLSCRRRKRKCDGLLPCGHCTEFEYHCDYDGFSPRKATSNDARTSISNPAEFADWTPEAHKSQTMPARSGNPNGHSKGMANNSANPNGRSTPWYGYLDSSKSRYMSKQSSIAFPRALGIDLQSPQPPRIHSFAYHLGTRQEMSSSVKLQLAEHVTLAQVRQLFEVYRQAVHPVFGFLDLPSLASRCELYWKGECQGAAFVAIISGVLAFASLFSGLLAENVETTVVAHAKEILESPSCSRAPNIELVMGWILRTMYLRATSKPQVTWLSSCITMHVVEAIGLHRKFEEVTLLNNANPASTADSSDTRERVFQIARSLNLMISYDYGRSAVNLGPISQRVVSSRAGDFTAQLCSMISGIAPDGQDTSLTNGGMGDNDLDWMLETMVASVADHDFIVLTRAEIAFCVYRRMHYMGRRLQQEQIALVIKAGTAAVDAARSLMVLRQPWWNIIGTVFHFVCVLLSINTNETLQAVADALQTLDQVAQQLDTHLAREAIQTAGLLVRASLDQRQKALQNLEYATTLVSSQGGPPPDLSFVNDDWNVFLQPFDELPLPDDFFPDMLK